jgi:hypothetical protein
MIEIVLLVILLLLIIGALPVYGYSRTWGYTPAGAMLFILLILIILSMTGTIRVRASAETDHLPCSASSIACQA